MEKDTLILAIESSCDETAVAILKNETELLANEVFSQIKTHQEFGGVLPEVASRIHVEMITIVIEKALKTANCSMQDITAIAITYGPGLIGSLHVGLQAAKTLSWLYDIPLIPVHHIVGHMYANAYVTTIQYPFVCLVVSGGHTELVLSEQENKFKVIASTVDDAIGEAYDKVARIMNVGYPGGPILDKMATLGHHQYDLPKVKTNQEDEFSFSGLKSAIKQCVEREEKKHNVIDFNNLAYDFQEAALGQLIDKTRKVIQKVQPKQVLLGGGVAANSRLRSLLQQLMVEFPHIELIIPPIWCCTDNAAMIAKAAAINYRHGIIADLNLGARSSENIENI